MPLARIALGEDRMCALGSREILPNNRWVKE